MASPQPPESWEGLVQMSPAAHPVVEVLMHLMQLLLYTSLEEEEGIWRERAVRCSIHQITEGREACVGFQHSRFGSESNRRK